MTWRHWQKVAALILMSIRVKSNLELVLMGHGLRPRVVLATLLSLKTKIESEVLGNLNDLQIRQFGLVMQIPCR